MNWVKRIELAMLMLLVLFGVFLMFYKLSDVPNGLYVDEALSGYNAYSLLSTGKDEYGKSFPIAFRFFGSYSPPLYTYLTAPMIALFGLSIFSVRLVSVISGLLGVLVMFLFLKNLGFLKDKFTPLLGTFLFLIEPWNVFYSRIGYEINLALFLFSLGALLVFLGTFKKPIFATLGLGVLSISTYAAHTQIFLIPIFILAVLAFFYDKESKTRERYFWYGIMLALALQIPHLLLLNTSVFLVKNNLFYSGEIINGALKLSRLIPYPIAFILSFIHEFLSRYLSYFSPRSLFYFPDPDLQRSIPEMSVFYFWLVVPYFVGIYSLIKNWTNKRTQYIILLFVLSPIPAALTLDPFSTQRALPFLLPSFLTIALGVDTILQKVNIKLGLPVLMTLTVLSLVSFWRSYFVLLPHERATNWGYGFKDLANYILVHSDQNFVIDQARIKPAYIELAFFLKIPPSQLQQSVSPKIVSNYYNSPRFDSYYKVSNFETRDVDWTKDEFLDQVLVGDELTFSENQKKEHFLKKVFEIRDPVSNIVFVGYKTNPLQKCQATNYENPKCSLFSASQRMSQ